MKWPSSLIFDISENYRSESQDCPIKLEDAYLETVRPVLPGDPMDPLIRCRLAIELYLCHKDSYQNNSSKRQKTEQDFPIKQESIKQESAQGYPPPNPPIAASSQSFDSQAPSLAL